MNGDFWRRMGLPWQRRPHFEDEVDDELRFHVEMRARELMAAGMEEGEALRSASERFGDLGDTRRRYVSGRARRGRKGRRRQWLLDLGQDLRYGLRAAGRRPGFSAAVIAVLALGIGAPTTVFTLVDAIFFQRPPHIEAPDELVRVFRAWAPGVGGGNIEYDDYRYYRDNASTLSGLAAYGGLGVAAYRTSGGERDQLRLQFVSDNYFEVLGTTPHLGRWFLEAENSSPGRDPVVVVGHGFWTRALGGDPDAVGRSLQINGTEMTVIGVAPDGFAGTANAGPAPDAWTPIAMRGVLARLEDTAWWTRSSEFRERWLDAVGRLAPGVTFEAARDNLVALGEGLAYEGKSPEEGALVSNQVLYRPRQDRELSSLSRMLVAAVFVVLAVAAANVAVLLLSRGAGRSREMAVRTALGAGASRLVRQLLTETVILGAAGGLLGVTLAFAFADLAATLLPVPLNASFTPDGWVLAAATVISLATSILVGLAPALQGARTEVRSAMQDQSLHPGRGRLRGGLVVVQIGLSVVLLAGALMFAASFAKASSQDLGFDPEDVAVLETNLRNLGYDPDQGRVLHRQALDRLAALPGVSAVALSRQLPFGGEWSTSFEAPEGAVANAPDNQMDVGLNAVGPGYFELMGIPIVEGRALAAEHGDGGLAGVVVNETLAEALWPGEPAAGRVLDVGTPFTVVGVARDAVYYRLDEGPRAQAYLSTAQSYPSSVHFLLKGRGSDDGVLARAQAVLRELEPGITFSTVTTLTEVVDDQVRRYEVSAVLVGLFSVVALLLASTGLYGVISYLVSRKRRELGIRMALGADGRRVAGQVLVSGLRLSAGGLAVGITGAFFLRRVATDLLYQVDPGSPAPVIGAAVVLLLVTGLACLAPSRRAIRIGPGEAIRTEP